MNRFVVAAALAVAAGLGSSSRADAQFVYGYTTYAPGGVVNTRTVGVPGLYAQNYSTFYSPYTGVMSRQMSYSDVYGLNYGRAATYNPWLNLGYRSGYYQPGYPVNPFGTYSYYGGVYRRW